MQFDVSRTIFNSQSIKTLALAFVLAIGFSFSAFADEKFDLSPRQSSATVRDVQVVLEVTGDLKLNADGKEVTELPMRVSGRLRYDERTLRPAAGSTSERDARFYHQAKATIAVGGGRHQTELRDDRRLVIADVARGQQTLFSPLGPLTRDDLDLIQTLGSSSLLDRLAPSEPVSLGQQWPHDAIDLAPLLGLDAIHQSDVKSTLRQVESNVAIVDMSGKVSGAIDGVASDMVLKAKYNINVQSRRVTWLAMSIREDRAIGHATPGFDVTARVRVEINDQANSTELAISLLDQLPLDLTPAATLLRHESDLGGFALLHGRDWQVMVDRHDVTVLRMIEKGELIAQCNISTLPSLAPGNRVQLPVFQADIEKALGKNFVQFVEASQQRTQTGHRVLRAVVSGLASELPIQWIYYHISDDEGHQTALVFTMDAKVAEKFGAADQSMIGTFEFVERSAPTPAAANRADTATKPTSNRSTTSR